ncbi:type IV conjugative transfer system coupling protein TraD [Pasteurella skyensis]|uniref:type IV conjugative transfer system coupling protein TraD n=1 Tax=Phocoenobacter skyensis TaxID=97481 RepID=UPI00274A482D|nr:type IV conjugative transfer system coupling protein TraD [Pasteurella skyensis]MDP8189077.1 type IV conjugative transfer system coupling protein TraD [Pasteurella skyensis]
MSDKFLVESLLRPPVELYTAGISASAAALCTWAPWSIALTPSVGYGMAAGFTALSVKRYLQAHKIIKYQRNLKRLPYYELESKNIPVTKKGLFLGRGFQWTQTHTQRLHDCGLSNAQKYIQPSWTFKKIREFERTHEGHPLTKITSLDTILNPYRPLPPVGGKPEIHGVELDEVDVFLNAADRAGHTLINGTTGVGKTRCAEILVTQDIHRGKTFKDREVVIVIDPKGDADLLMRMYTEAKRAGRENEFYVFHLGYPEASARYNAIGRFNKITEVASRISGQLSGAGNSAAFKEFAWRFVNIISRALVALGIRPNYEEIARYVRSIDSLFLDYAKVYFNKKDPAIWNAISEIAASIDPKNLSFAMKGRDPLVVAVEQYIRETKEFEPVLDGLCSAVRYDKTYFDKIVASLLPLLEKLTTGKVSELLSPDYSDIKDSRPIFDWEMIIRKKGIVYVGLDALSDLIVSSSVGNSMLADLVSIAGHIYKFGIDDSLPQAGITGKAVINLHADEFNELIGEEFIPMLNKARGAGINVTAYTQTLSDVEARLGNKAKAGQTIGNFNSLLMFRVKELATAELLTSQLAEVSVNDVMAVSSVTDSSDPSEKKDFNSSTGDRVISSRQKLISPADIINLPKGQAFALLEGGKLWKIRMPLPAKTKDEHMPESLQKLVGYMRDSYQSSAVWWEGSQTYQPNSNIISAFENLNNNTYH